MTDTIERLISADSHVTVTHDQVKARLATKHHDDYDAAVAQLMGGMRPQGDQTGMPTQFKFSAMGRPGTFDPHERLKDMDQVLHQRSSTAKSAPSAIST